LKSIKIRHDKLPIEKRIFCRKVKIAYFRQILIIFANHEACSFDETTITISPNFVVCPQISFKNINYFDYDF